MKATLIVSTHVLACGGASDGGTTEVRSSDDAPASTAESAAGTDGGPPTSTSSNAGEGDGSGTSGDATETGSNGTTGLPETTGSSAATTSGGMTECDQAAPPSQGLIGWLSADEGVARSPTNLVQGWNDRADPAHTVAPTGGAPTWVGDAASGRPAVRFDGEDDELSWRDFAVDGATELSIAIVNTADFEPQPVEWCCHTGESGCSGTYDIVFSVDGIGDWGGVIVSPLPEEVAIRFGNGRTTYSDGFYENEAWGSGGYGTCRPDPARDPKVAWRRASSIDRSLTYTVAVKSPSLVDLFVEGQWVWSREMPEGVQEIQNTGTVAKLGGGGYSSIPSRRFGGDIAEILIYGIALSEGDRLALERYIVCKYFPEFAAR